MGLLDKIKKAANIVNDILDDAQINGSNKSGAPKPAAAPAAENNMSARYLNHLKDPQKIPTTPPEVAATGNEPIGAYKTALQDWNDIKQSFEIPESFTEFESHAEPEMCYQYMFKDEVDVRKPIICVTPENFAYLAVDEFNEKGTAQYVYDLEPVTSEYFRFRAKSKYFGQTAYFYGGSLAGDMHRGLAVIYCSDLKGTPLEKKLMEILDHAAETYKEWQN